MDNRWCTACGCEFTPHIKTPRQSYCSKPQCQRERKRLWQQLKRRSDPDYLENQARAQHDWARRNAEYWREYRRTHPSYAEHNRDRQRAKRHASVAKTDASSTAAPLASGIYELRMIDIRGVAKMDAIHVILTVIETPRPA